LKNCNIKQKKAARGEPLLPKTNNYEIKQNLYSEIAVMLTE